MAWQHETTARPPPPSHHIASASSRPAHAPRDDRRHWCVTGASSVSLRERWPLSAWPPGPSRPPRAPPRAATTSSLSLSLYGGGELDLRSHEQREICKMLCTLAVEEPGENWVGEE